MFSNAFEACNKLSSDFFFPASCNPTGNPDLVNPHGNETAGFPLQLNGAVN